MSLGPTELIIILGIVMMLFGAKKVPDLARSLGQAQREFKKGTTATADEVPVAPATVTVPVTPPAPTVTTPDPQA